MAGQAFGLVALLAAALSLPPCAASGGGLALDSRDGASGAITPIPATLAKPAGAGPFPALVMLHDCSGLGPRSSGAPARWTEFLVARGYVVITPDSFTPRGHADGVCTVRASGGITARVRMADAYAALRYLQAQPFVDPARIGVMGGSHGGWSTLAAFNAEAARPYVKGQAAPAFAAAVALYPVCGARFGSWGVKRADGRFGPITETYGVYRPEGPLLILIGGRDDWTPAAPCEALARAAQAEGLPVEIKVYPDAHHAFDSDRRVHYNPARSNANKPGGCCGATTGGNPADWADAKLRVARFLARHLGGRAE